MKSLPAYALHALMDVIDLGDITDGQPMKILDPCARTGCIREAVNSYKGEAPAKTWTLNDWAEDMPVAFHYDYLADNIEWERQHLTIMYPPRQAQYAFINKAITHSQAVIALVRHDWLATAKYGSFLRVHKPDIFLLPDRISLDGQAQENSKFCWLRWPWQGIGLFPLHPTPKAIRVAQMETTKQEILEQCGQSRLELAR